MAPKRPAGNTNGRYVVNAPWIGIRGSGHACLFSGQSVTRTERPIMYLAEERNATLGQQLENWTPPERETPSDLNRETVMDALHILPFWVLPL